MNKEARIAMREERERKRLQKKKKTPRAKHYIWILFMIIVLVNMLDEVTSSIGGTVTTNMVEDFFVRNPFFGKTYTLEEGIALNSTIGLLTGIVAFIAPFYKVLGDRRIALVREITKIHEEVIRTTISEAIIKYENEAPKGEFVLVIEGKQEEKEEITFEDALSLAKAYLSQGMSVSMASKQAAKETGIKKGDLYKALGSTAVKEEE